MQLNKDPSHKELLWFGAGLPLFAGVVGFVIGHRTGSDAARSVVWAAGAALTLLFWAVKGTRRPLFLGFGYATFPIGWVVSKVLLGLVFLGVVTPTGFVMRLLGKDLLAKRLNRGADSYWSARVGARSKTDYFRQW